MQEIKRYQVRGLTGYVNRVAISGRIIDFWCPKEGTDHLLIAHDGQNIFDRRTATFIYTWKLAQTAIRVAKESGKNPPLVIGVFHSSSKLDPNGRAKDLCPEDPFREGMEPLSPPTFSKEELRGNKYLTEIFENIVPEIAGQSKVKVTPEKSAMIGSSMGGLATLYAMTKHNSHFNTALALSPHWVLGGNPLVDWLTTHLPNKKENRVWMSRGTKGLDAAYKPYQERADDLMSGAKWDSRFKSKVFHRTTHNERSWASYLDEPLRFWLS